MSRKSNRAVVLLDILYLCTDTMVKTNAFARLDLKADLAMAKELVAAAVHNWPGFANKSWIMEAGKQFRLFAESVPAREFETSTIVAMCERLVADLQDVARTDLKKELILPLVPIYRKLHNHVDPLGCNFCAYSSSDKLLDELYRIIGLEV